jgi:PKD repeat protein
MGADIGALRSLQYPKSHANPDSYQGTYWADINDNSTTGDNGGVHTNSGVQNKWFFILTVGEQGVNDKNATYSVKGIGMLDASKIAFRTLTTYLTSGSDYSDARTNSLKAATDLFGSCSQQYVSTAYAWDAVNVTGTFSCSVAPNAGFNSSFTDRCVGSVQFKDLSSGKPTSWAWDFGDGQSASTQNPSHTYAASGTYTVILTATSTGGSNKDTSTVVITLPTGPNVTPGKRCGPGVVNLGATSTNGGTVNWFSGPSGGNTLTTGTTYTPNLSTTTTYYVENTLDLTPQKIGAVDSNALARGGFFTANYIHGLYFDVLSPLTIKSVKVYAGSAGDRVIDIVDIHGEPVLTTKVTIPKGESRVTLNFNLVEGTQYFMKVSGTLLDLQRAKGGATFPYTISNLISITETDVKSTAPNSYYFFYDWEVVRAGCPSPRVPIIGTVNPAITKPVIKETNKILSTTTTYASYQWYLDGKPINGATNQTYNPTKNGDYTVVVSTEPSCDASSDIYLFKIDGIAEALLDATVNVYPNPANETLFVEVPMSTNNEIKLFVYSVIGKLIYQETYSNSGQAHSVNLGGIDANGIYFLQLQSGSTTITKKFNVNR